MPWTATSNDLLDQIIDRASLARMANDERDRAVLLLAAAARKYVKAGNDLMARKIERAITTLEVTE